MEFANIGVSLAFLAGLASFLSPCVFALVPAYVGYLGGRSVATARGGSTNPWVPLSHGIAFVTGFSTVFILLGVATAALGGLLYDARFWLARIGGVVVIIFGLHMTGLVRLRFLEYDLRSQAVPNRNRGYLASFLMGIFFSAGWSPCVGPILGSILTLSLNGGSISQGVLLLSAYSAGLAIPFLIASVQIGLVTTVLRRYGKVMHYVEVGMGVLLLVVGVLLLTGGFQRFAQVSASLFTVYNEVALGKLLFIILLALMVLGLLPAFIAHRKGRHFFTWWLFGVTFIPAALPMALMLSAENGGPNEGQETSGAVEASSPSESI